MYGFVLSRGAYVTFSYAPGAATRPWGINNRGAISGTTWGADGGHAFVCYRAMFTQLQVPGAQATLGRGINDAGRVAGFYTAPSGLHYGVVWK